MAAIARELKSDPSIRLVEVQGHADERGDEGANLELTRARAEAVVRALVAQGVDPSRLRSAGFGARCPSREACQQHAAPGSCHGEDAWQLDRRVAFLILESGGERFTGAVACPLASDLVPADDHAYVAGRN